MEEISSSLNSRSMPFMKWFAGDWLNDPCVSLCSPSTRGIWTDLLNAMHLLDQRGVISGTADQLARVARCSAVEVVHALDELSTFRAAEVTSRKIQSSHGKVTDMYTVTNRRMSRAKKEKVQARDRKRRERENAKNQSEAEQAPSKSKKKGKTDPKESRKKSQECHADGHGDVTDESRDRDQSSDIRDQSINPPLNAGAREHQSAEDERDQGDSSVVIPPCTLKEALFLAGTSGIPDDVATTWWEKHDAEDWRPYPGKLALTKKSWKFDLKNYADNRKRYEDEFRNRGNGAATKGKVSGNSQGSTNPRNAHVTDDERDYRKHGYKVRDIVQHLDTIAQSPEADTFPGAIDWRNSPYLEQALQRLRDRNPAILKRLAEQCFIDEKSQRPIESNGHSGGKVERAMVSP